MKIGIDVRCLMQTNYSGVSWYTYNLLLAISQIDQNNEYLLFYNNRKDVDMPVFRAPIFQYKSYRLSNKILNLYLLLFNKPKIDKLIGGVDVFFMPNINFVAISAGCKKIVTVHDLSYLRYPHFWNAKSRWWHKILLSKKILHQADKIIAVSNSTKYDLMDLLGIDESKISVVYEGVDPKFRPITNETELNRVRKKYNLPAKFILCLATLEPRKNIEGVIEAYNKLNSDIGLVIGGGYGWKYKQIKKLVSKNKNIKLIGYVDESDKRALYNMAKVFVYPSYYEGFGLPPLEAMACGVPTIVGANSSQLEIVGDAGLLVDPHNIEDIYISLNTLLHDSDFTSKIITRGLDRVKKFSWQSTASQTINVLTK